MDLNAAKSYALDYLMKFVGQDFQYHNLSHTLDVFQSVSMLALSEKINEHDLILLQTAALYHDMGIHINYFGHEKESIQIIERVLPGFDFKPSEITAISKLIADTCITCIPQNNLGKLLCDADLDYLGREDYLEISKLLRKEWEICGIKTFTDKEWYFHQLDYLSKHRYYSDTAKKTRNKGRLNNIDVISKILKNL